MLLACVIGYSEGVSARLVRVLAPQPERVNSGLRQRSEVPKAIPSPDMSCRQLLEAQGALLEVCWPDGRRADLDTWDEGVRVEAARSYSVGAVASTWVWIAPRAQPGELRITAEWPAAGIVQSSINL